MSSVRRRRDRIVVRLAEHEQRLMSTLLTQYRELLAGDDDADPVFGRLYPDGYADDAEAAVEFRRYTRDALRSHKTAAADAVASAVDAGSPIEVPVQDALRWLSVLTDLRLVVAERLGIRSEDDSPEGVLADVYHWLGELQWFLLHAVDEED